MYKHILFDIDSTLIDFKKSFAGAARKVLTLGGHEVNDKYIEQYFRFNDDMWFGLNLNEIDREDIRKNYHLLYVDYINQANANSIKEMGLNLTTKEATECFMDELGACAVPSPHAVEVCRELSKNHKLHIATNGLVRIQPGKLTQFKKYLTNIYISEDLGCIKPTKEYFDYIINDIGCHRDEVLMVGDSLPNDINGANMSGIDSCYYNPNGLNNMTGIKGTYEIKDFTELLDIL